ncbi:hypothetical protein [Cytobacillus sp. IB215665]|uniref:hypothetical protein n=1 Tax=Cytobacillus sp. IB215665 TaxID=3097357 RepID=UPI002A0D7DEA|nr:hypothetical protein [Cytobacillus sp. IB215665]MDX8366235.1 hypothetical protein [Cytobacillus sp. IB215665]
MRKQLLYLAIITIYLSSCSSQFDVSQPEKYNETEVVITGAEKEPVDLNKEPLDVKITLPIALFVGNDIELVASDGITEVNYNSDGSVTCTMTTSKFKEMKQEMYNSLLETIEWIEHNKFGNFVSIKDVIHNQSFSEFTLLVDREQYENSNDSFASIDIGRAAMYYQLFNSVKLEDNKVLVFIKNDSTGKIFKTDVYPDALNHGEFE